VAKEEGKLDEIREELAQVAQALEESRELSLFLFSPYFSTEEKKEGLHRAITEADETLVNFLELLLENHRMPALHRIRREYDALWREENQLLPVQVTSAVELDERTIDSIGDRIAEQTGRQVELSSSVDPDLVGGIVLRVGNSILDASIRNRLEQLRKQVARA
jgi:F-type H+-transporting ATPase subunit delta